MRLILFLLLTAWIGGCFSQQDSPLETVLQKGHSDYITAYDFSADNQFVITGSYDNILILWQLNSGKQMRTFTGHTATIYSIEISPDQKHVLSVSSDNTAKVFDIVSGKLIHDFSIEGKDFLKGYYSENGTYIYILDNRGAVYVWNNLTGKKVGTYEKDYAAHNEPHLIHPTQPWILSVENYDQTHVVDIETKDTVVTLPFDKTHSQSFSPDGKTVVVSSRKLKAQSFDVLTGELLHTFENGEEQCDGCNTKHAISPDNKWVFTLSNREDGTLWDLKSGQKIRSFLTSRSRASVVKFSSKGNYVMVVYDKEVAVFNTKTGKRMLQIESKYIDYLDVKFTPNEKQIIIPNQWGGLELWNVSNGRKSNVISGYLNESQNSGMNLSYSNWIDQGILQYIQNKRKVLLSPDNSKVLIGAVDTVALLIDLKTGKEVLRLEGHEKDVYAFDFSPDGKFIATGGGDRIIRIWDSETGMEVDQLIGHRETIFDLKYSKDGSAIVSGAWDGTILTWDLKEDTYQAIYLDKNSPYTVDFSPNELYLVIGDLGTNVQFWERDAGKLFRTLVGHTHIPSSIDFSPNGKEIVTAAWDGHVKVWDVLTGMLVNRMDEHRGHVYTAKYDPLGQFVASGGADSDIILWDPNSNNILHKLSGHSTAVTSIDFTSDGTKLISISQDGLMNCWDLSNYELLFSRVQLSRTDWLATSPSGLFDGSSKALGWVNYVRGEQVVNVSSLFDKYYTPGLIEMINSGKKLNDRGEIQPIDMDIPTIQLALGGTGKRNIQVLRDSVYAINTASFPLEVEIGEHNLPLDEIRVYNNGKLVLRESMEENIVFRGGGKNKRIFELPLVDGTNEFKVVVVNANRTESAPARVIVNYNGEKAKTDLYIVAIGINQYKNKTYNLDYAVNDSKAFVKTIKKGADSLFNEIYTYSIINQDATQEGIEKVIKLVQAEIGSEDVFLFYYAGHGVMSASKDQKNDKFYIVTHDITNLYAEEQVLEEKAISANDLMQYSIDVKAQKQLFVLDACHSGGALEAFNTRGSEREKALAQLARNTGTFFITAAQDAEYANEVGKLNHGLFTYALLEMLNGNEKGNDQKVTVNELKTYVEERVPELTEEYHGSPQYPTGYSFGQDFPIVIVK